MPRLRYTAHALERMAERHIGRDTVRLVIEDPDSTEDTPKQSRKFTRNVNGRTFKVWVKWPPRGDGTYVVGSAV